MFIKKQQTKSKICRFREDMDQWNQGRVKFAEEYFFESENVQKMILQLKRLDRTACLEVFINQRLSPQGMQKMKVFSHLEVMTSFSIEDLNFLKLSMDRAGGMLSLRLFILFSLNQSQGLRNNEIFYNLQGIIFLFYQICVETNQVQLDVFRKILREASSKEFSLVPGEGTKGFPENFICKYIEDHLENILLYQSDVSEYILSVQRYGKSILRVREQQQEGLYDFGLKKPIKYYANRYENMPKLEVQSKFVLQEGRKKLYALRVKCVGYYERMDLLMISREVSSEIHFYNIREQKSIGKLDMMDICNSSTSIITSFSVSEEDDAHLLFVCTSDRSIFIIPLDPERTRSYSEVLDSSIILKSQVFFCSEPICALSFVSDLDILVGVNEEGSRLIFWHDVKKEYFKHSDIRGAPRSMKFHWKEGLLKPSTLRELKAFTWVILADSKNHLVIIDPQKAELVLQARSSSVIHTIICDPHGQKIIGIGFEKVYWVYETSKYYREVRSVVFRQAHASIIVFGEIIPNRRVFVTCDETQTLKSWDIDSMNCLQIFKLNFGSPTFGLAHIGYQGFIVLSNLIYFMVFENNQDNYTAIKEENDVVLRAGGSREILVVPKLPVRLSNGFLPEYYVGTSSEIRSYQFEDSIMQFRYRARNIIPALAKFPIASFDLVDLPVPGIVVASETGSLVLCPLNNEDPQKCVLREGKEDIEHVGKLIALVRSPRYPQVFAVHLTKVKLFDICKLD